MTRKSLKLSEGTPAFTTVLWEWTAAHPDPIQYKPYAPAFKPSNDVQRLYVEVSVPTKSVKGKTRMKLEDGSTVEAVILTPEGAAYALKSIASAILEVQTSFSPKRS